MLSVFELIIFLVMFISGCSSCCLVVMVLVSDMLCMVSGWCWWVFE